SLSSTTLFPYTTLFRSVSAVDEHPNIGEWQCGICAGRFESMGRVERDRLIHEHIAAVCDERCTSARGPICNCHCGGQHHGSNRRSEEHTSELQSRAELA